MPKPRRKAFSNASKSKWFAAQQLVDAKRPRCPNQASCNSNTHFVWLICCVWLFQNHNVLIWNDWFKIRLPVFIFVGLPLTFAQNKNHGKCLWIFQYHFRISEFLEHANCRGWKQAVAQPDPQIFFQYFESKLDSTFDVKYTHKYTISVVPNPHFDRKLQSFYQIGFPFSQIMYGLMFSLRTVAWKSPARNKF